MSAFEESRAYKIVAEDAAGGTLSHAYLLVCPDARNLRTFLKELAKLVIGADTRAARLIGAEMYSDCRVFPAPEAKATVADVKELLDDCYIRPVEGERKVFVLDNMQDMLAPAQNKLLKVLEEPPANVHFLLGTTNEFPVLPTVRSRAKKLELFSFPESAVEAHIRALYPARKDAREIAALSGGVLGRAEELAEGGSLAEEGEAAAQLLATLSPAGVPAAVRSCADRAQAGRMLALMRLCLRDALMCRLGKEELISGGAENARRIAARYSAAALVRAQDAAARAEKELKFNANLAMCLEALFIAILEGR